ncbi:MAG: glucose-1-phosphate adenylyltransferase [Anaerolineae bacterium]|jgi:glucose-1-phosphate adenylyltransferase|nr:glucose-1-phosphate adenylyltransferase [Anaerolineae bacterium]
MRVVAMILAGGAGTRLGVLSEQRAKPAVPFAGRFRIIDFTLSNCVNSGIYEVGVLTQYLPRSLNDHIGIGRPWDLDRSRGGVRLLQPYQGRGQQDWYGGTADAVLQNLDYLQERRADTVVILSGDHIYKMDFRPMLRLHEERRADLTVAVMNVAPEETSRFGIVLTDETGRVTQFLEKPKDAPSTLANMGVYIFNTNALTERMQALAPQHPDLDFGKHVIPSMVESHAIYTYPFDGYWVDVGTVEAYWQTSMELTSGESKLNLYDPGWVIHTKSEERPPAKIGPQGSAQDSLICNGCNVRGQVVRSVLSPGVHVSPGAVVRDSVIMNDCWLGPGSVVDRCIIDKEATVGAGTQLGWGDDLTTPNERFPDRFNTGPTMVGRGAHVPGYRKIGRNVVIEAGVDEDAFGAFGEVIPSGATVE